MIASKEVSSTFARRGISRLPDSVGLDASLLSYIPGKCALQKRPANRSFLLNEGTQACNQRSAASNISRVTGEYILKTKFMLAAAAALTFSAAGAAYAQAQVAEDPAFTAKLRASLDANPELITQAMEAAQNKQRQAEQADMLTRVDPARPALFADDFGPFIGNPNGTVRVVEFVDYACPICKSSNASIESIVSKRDDVRITIAMRNIFGEDSDKLARFALASSLQGKFAETHTALYEAFGDHHQTKPDEAALRGVAKAAGLNYDKVVADMNGPVVNAMLEKQTELANQIGVSGTPFFVTSDAVYPGAAPEEVMNEAFR